MSRFVLPVQQPIDGNGNPYAGAKLYFYESGTSTPKDTFSDSALTIPNDNPVIADANGDFGDIFLQGEYKVNMTTSGDVAISGYPKDPIGPEYGETVDDIASLKLIEGTANQRKEVLSYYAPNYALANPYDGGGGSFAWDATSTETDNGGTIIKATAVVTGRWIRTDYGSLNALMFGVKIDGVTDDYTMLAAYRSYCESTGEATKVPAGTCKINTGLNIDLGLASFECDGTTFDCAGMTTGSALNIYSSLAFPALKNAAHKASGFVLEGGAVVGVHGITFGHATNDQSGEIHIDDWAVRQFDRNLNYINNAWRVNHGVGRNENPVNYFIYYPGSTLSNSGEVMKFDHVMFADGEGEIYIDGHQWDFYGCSILNALLNVVGDTTVNLFGPNIENPGNTGAGYRMITVQDPDSTVNIYGGRLTLNDPGGGTTWDNVPFECATGVVGGLHFHGFKFPAGSAFFKPENDAAFGNNRLLVGGLGRVTMDAGCTFSGFASNSDLVIAQGANVIYNGDAELNATTGWTITTFGSGGPATFTATAGSKRNGTYGFDLDCVAATAGVEVIQDVPCEPGKYVVANIPISWLAGAINIQLRFRDSLGNNITSIGQSITSGAGFIIRDLSGIAPAGTTTVRVEIVGAVDAATTHAYIDDIIVNIV